ncbi:hypothetical protein ABT369_38740 [Dactylosporangium sp. NPDC000244]|uniref:hypothetical protein n=1 Tax=Dactylosporangium sp. NPDC000244 TaxID=3154365 RepID=UPI0033239F77
MSDVIALHNGAILEVHDPARCAGQTCCIHAPSNHLMLGFPQHWRSDRQLMERICPHGIGHPDPDDIAFKWRTRGDQFARYEAIHGCDGCCTGGGTDG